MPNSPTPPPGRTYLPAMRYAALLPLYDACSRLLGAPAAHRRLLDQAAIAPGHRVLEIGCGTGNLLLLTKRTHPEATVVGLDPDPDALAWLRRKAARAGTEVNGDLGFADQLPYPDAAFDRVLSALMLHHLPPAERSRALREVRRVLRPGGSLHLLDLTATPAHERGRLERLLHRGHSGPHAHLAGADDIRQLLTGAGLTDVAETGHHRGWIGRYTWYRGTAP